ncbi:unnamed protein product, partial [Musa textilis]
LEDYQNWYRIKITYLHQLGHSRIYDFKKVLELALYTSTTQVWQITKTGIGSKLHIYISWDILEYMTLRKSLS